MLLHDRTTKIFMNTKGTENDVSESVKRFLRFLEWAAEPAQEDELLVKMYRELQSIRKDQKWRRAYMTYLMELQEREEEGRKQGLKQGRRELLRTMLENGTSPEEVMRLTKASREEVEEAAEEMES